jgi:hypothetical protein
LVARWENERLCPKVVVFPQFAHLAILNNFLSCYNSMWNESTWFKRLFGRHGILPHIATFFKARC